MLKRSLLTTLSLALSLVASCSSGSSGGGSGSSVGTILNSPSPVSGATVTFVRGEQTYTTTTTATGTFRIDGIPKGTYDVTISGKGVFDSTGNPIADKLDLFYPGVHIGGGDNVLGDKPVFLPEKAIGTTIDTGGTASGLIPAGTVIANADAGASIVFETATTVTFEDAEDTTLSVTSVPAEQTPFPLPSGLSAGEILAIQPLGATFDVRPKLVVANTVGVPEGSKDVPLYRFDEIAGDWVQFGTGRADVDGTSIVSDAGQGLTQSGWVAPLVSTFCTTTVSGTVEDDLGAPVANALVTTVNGVSATTDVFGAFSVADVPLPNAAFPVVVTVVPETNGGFFANDSAPVLGVCGGTTDVGTVVVSGLAIDTTAPGVATTLPADGANGVPDNTSITILFDEVISPGTIHGETIQVLVDGVAVGGNIGISQSGGQTTVTFLPLELLPLDSTCTLSISGVVDAAGNAMEEDFFASFATVKTTAGGTPTVDITPDGPIAVDPGTTGELLVSVLDAAGATVEGAVVTWESDNLDVATVDAGGTVTAIGPGSANITARFGNASDTEVVDVAVPAIAAVVVSPDTQTLAVGASLGLQAEAQDAGAAPLEGFFFDWSSDDKAVATVDASGNVTALASGSAVITCTEPGSGFFDTVAIDVVNPADVTSVEISPASFALNIGSATQLSAAALDTLDDAIPGVSFTWSSSDSNVATVSPSGVVTGVAEGEATISAVADGSSSISGVSGVTSFFDVALVVTVFGGPEGDDPQPGVRVFRHDADSGAFIEEVTTDDLGMASFGLTGAPRASVTAFLDDLDAGGEAELLSLIDIPVGCVSILAGGNDPLATFDIDVDGLPGSTSEVTAFTSGYGDGESFTDFAQPPTATVSSVEVEEVQPDGNTSLIVVSSDSKIGLPNAAGFLLDVDPALIDGVTQNVTVDASNLSSVPFTSDVPVVSTGGYVRRSGVIWDQHFGVPSATTSGTAWVAVPGGSDRISFVLEIEPTQLSPTGLGREFVFNSVPSSIDATMPDLSISNFTRDGSENTTSFSVSGKDASDLDVATVEQEYLDGQSNEIAWELIFDPEITSVTAPDLPLDLAGLMPPVMGVSYGIELIGLDGVSGFDAALELSEPYLGNYQQFLLDASIHSNFANRQLHPVEFSITGAGTVTLDDGQGPVIISDGTTLEFNQGTSLSIVASADAGSVVTDLTCPSGPATGLGTDTALCSFDVEDGYVIRVTFEALP